MSKKFKGKLCVYCAKRPSSVGEHVFAREFFLPEHRGNLPKVPACPQCNVEKSKLEHYLCSVLPFGGRHESAGRNLSSLVPKRLEKNTKLHRELNTGRTSAWSFEGGAYLPTMAIPFESEALIALFAFIAKGLLWFHWNTYHSEDDIVDVILLSKHGEEYFEQNFMKLLPRERVAANLGNGTFLYQGSLGVDISQISVWRFSMFGGLVLSGDPSAPNETSSTIGVLTGPRSVFGIA